MYLSFSHLFCNFAVELAHAPTFMDRTFPQRMTVPALCGILLLAMAAFSLFWYGHPLFGLCVMLLAVVALEHRLHACYTFSEGWLIVHRGRFLRPKKVELSSIKGYVRMKGPFGLSHFLMLEYDGNRLMAVEPRNEADFIAVLESRIRKS